MELRYLLHLLRRSRTLLAASALVGCGLALIATYVLPEKFEATTSVLIRPRREPTGDSSQKAMMDYPVSFNIPVDTMSKTYAEIMASEAVASRVVGILHLDTVVTVRDPRWYVRTLQTARDHTKLAIVRSWEFLRYGRIEPKDPRREAIQNVMSGLKVKPVTDTFVFSLTGTARDPHLAATIADTAAAVFIDYTRSARMDEEVTGARDIRQRLATVRDSLEQARTRLQDFGDGTSAASLDHELQLRLDELAKFDTEREDVLKQLTGLRAETATLQRQLGGQSEAVRASTTVVRNPVVTEIETVMVRSQVEYAGLAKTLQSGHPRMLELQAQIDEARERLGTSSAQIPDRDTSTPNPTRERINQTLLDRVAVLDNRAGHLHALDQIRARLRPRVDSLTQQKGELSRLRLDVDVLESEYRLLSRQEAESSLAAIQQVAEIRQIHTAVPPVYPARPIKIYYAMAGLAMGFLLSLLSVLILDYVHPTVYDLGDIQSRFGVPLVAVVPHAGGGLLNTGPPGTLLGRNDAAIKDLR